MTGKSITDIKFNQIERLIPGYGFEFPFTFFPHPKQRRFNPLLVIDPFGPADAAQAAFDVKIFAGLYFFKLPLIDISR
ncbi:hypothetical protein D3C80_654650 [compost metagenome]